MEKINMQEGTILKVKPNFVLKTGEIIESSVKFVVVVSKTSRGTPRVRPLGKSDDDILYDKVMKWSKKSNCWRVYGHDTEVYFPPSVERIMP